MSKIDKVRAEIERHIIESKTRQTNLEKIGQENAEIVERPLRNVLLSILSFIDSLTEESESGYGIFDDPRYLEGFDTGRAVQKVFDEAEKNPDLSREQMDMYQRGVRDMRETMMLDSVKGTVRHYLHFSWLELGEGLTDYLTARFKDKEKVRVIAIKAEEK